MSIFDRLLEYFGMLLIVCAIAIIPLGIVLSTFNHKLEKQYNDLNPSIKTETTMQDDLSNLDTLLGM